MADTIRKVISITQISKKMKADGKTPFWHVVADNGDFYSIFKPDVEARLTEGTHAVMVEEKNSAGKIYRNIVGIAEAEMEPDGVDLDEIVPGGKEIQAPTLLPKKQQSIATNIVNLVDIRAQALACAVQLAAHGQITVQKIEPQSRIFFDYIMRGKVDEQDISSGSTDQVEQFVAE